MISVEEKLRVFSQYLLNKERSWGKGIITDVKNKQKELLESSRQKIEKEKTAIEERNKHTIFRDRNKIIAEGKNKAKTMELEEKNRILTDFKQLIFTQAKAFLTKPVYSDYLSSCVSGIPDLFEGKKELIIFVNERDLPEVMGLVNDLLKGYSIEYRNNTTDIIGGIIVEDAEKRIYCDFSVENLINTNYKFIGMTLNEFMEKQVN
jgi:vacuolar-type H+-ATPase subunit E/Vma4